MLGIFEGLFDIHLLGSHVCLHSLGQNHMNWSRVALCVGNNSTTHALFRDPTQTFHLAANFRAAYSPLGIMNFMFHNQTHFLYCFINISIMKIQFLHLPRVVRSMFT
ncbi:hypothetical protein O6H91_21G019500 [Diphasiastrum complanatum]|uniref:Uncharacterized protein n=1 Tax=Diphasiastrum complanatum TaxID=34168 RepID=A0ACC2AIF8_DIPCM|nr:hypothetical protein O6H91_21G019500 [Diphasiastrum complanatum]